MAPPASSESAPRFALISVDVPNNVNFRDNAATFGLQMSLIHNVIIRGLNSLYTKAPKVTDADALDFAGYALAWTHLLHDHHHGEETILFPFLQTKLDMGGNINQHKEFIGPMEAFERYMKEVQTKQATFDGQKARDMLESFGDVLVTHLHEEIPTLSPEQLSQFDQAELDKVVKVHDDHIKSLPLTEAHVFVLTHHDLGAVPSWPPAPAPVIFILKNLAYWRYSRYWKFAHFSRSGVLQTYPM